MAKNRKFKREYKVIVEGITTNDFMSEFIEKLLRMFIETINGYYKQTSVKLEKINND